MKRVFSLLLFAFTITMVANAQLTRLGGGVAITTGFSFNHQEEDSYRCGPAGLFLKGIYEASQTLHIVPSLTFMLPNITKESEIQEHDVRRSVSCLMFDLNGHYIINSFVPLEFYGLAGLNINYAMLRHVSTSGVSSDTFNQSDNALGLNIGAGTYIRAGKKLDMCIEMKYIISKYTQIVLNAGILFYLDLQGSN